MTVGETLKRLVVTVIILNNNISNGLQDGAAAPNEVPLFGGRKNGLLVESKNDTGSCPSYFIVF